jgi:hypothetical protein
MSLKDKLEIGLKPDAPYRPDNLPDFQRDDPACKVAGLPGDSPELEDARAACAAPPSTRPVRVRKKRERTGRANPAERADADGTEGAVAADGRGGAEKG